MLIAQRMAPTDDAAPPGGGASGIFDAPRNWRGECLFVRDTTWHPPVDVYETETQILIKAELAGVTINDFEVTVEKDMLTIAGTRADPAVADDGVRCVHHREIDTGRFERSVKLPSRVDRDSIAARLRDGFLDIEMDKDTGRPRSYSVDVG
jgi:HSP20 family protein